MRDADVVDSVATRLACAIVIWRVVSLNARKADGIVAVLQNAPSPNKPPLLLPLSSRPRRARSPICA